MSKLTHFDDAGQAHMVDVGDKPETAREAVASGRIERIIDSLPVGLYVVDREYRVQAWNRKRESGMQGVSREEAIGKSVFEILHRQPAEMLRRDKQIGLLQSLHGDIHARFDEGCGHRLPGDLGEPAGNRQRQRADLDRIADLRVTLQE